LYDDESGDSLTREVTLSDGSLLPSFVTYDLGAGTLLCSTSDNNDGGVYSIRVRVTDNNSLGASNGVQFYEETFVLTVQVFNTEPSCDSRGDITLDTHSGG